MYYRLQVHHLVLLVEIVEMHPKVEHVQLVVGCQALYLEFNTKIFQLYYTRKYVKLELWDIAIHLQV